MSIRLRMRRRHLTVHREGYERKGFEVRAHESHSRTGAVEHVAAHHVGPSHVPPASYDIEDRGAPGRGPKLITVKKGFMTHEAMRMGFIHPGQRISDMSDARIKRFAVHLAETVGPNRALHMFQAQVVFRKREGNSPFLRKMVAARNAIAAKYSHELAPTAAIRANLRRGSNPNGKG